MEGRWADKYVCMKVEIVDFPNCSGFFRGQNIYPNFFPNTISIAKLPLIINEEQKKVFKNLYKCEFLHTWIIFLTLGQIF